MIIIGSIIFLSTLFITISAFYIRSEYKKFTYKEDLKDQILSYRAKIKQAQDYFRNNYDSNVYNNIKLNLDFCLKLILNKDSEGQKFYLDKLFKILYEVGYRLKTKYDDVNYILQPMKSLREELITELTDYIKENSDDLN